MAALLTADQGDSDRIAIEIDECRNMGIKIMAPNVNESFGTFTVVTEGTKENKTVGENIKADTIRFGLKAIKNVGEHIVDELIKERKANGPFPDIFSLLKRVTDKDLNKKSLESLIKSGAMEDFGERGLLLANSERLLSYNKEEAKNKASMQESLFGDLVEDNIPGPVLNDAPPVEQNEKLGWEKELLGLYVSEHPFNLLKPFLEGYTLSLASLSGHKSDARITTAGIISTIKKIITRKGDSMIFVKIEDALSSSELLIFPKLYKETMEIWEEGRALIVAGKISEKDQDIKILADKVAILNLEDPKKSINDFKKMMLNFPIQRKRYTNGASQGYSPVSGSKMISKAESQKKKEDLAVVEEEIGSHNSLRLSLEDNFSATDLSKLKEIFSLFSGSDDVYFRIEKDGKYKVIKTNFKVNIETGVKEKIKSLFKDGIKIAD
jgi:DNA polymerase-3 subunit alpha